MKNSMNTLETKGGNKVGYLQEVKKLMEKSRKLKQKGRGSI